MNLKDKSINRKNTIKLRRLFIINSKYKKCYLKVSTNLDKTIKMPSKHYQGQLKLCTLIHCKVIFGTDLSLVVSKKWDLLCKKEIWLDRELKRKKRKKNKTKKSSSMKKFKKKLKKKLLKLFW